MGLRPEQPRTPRVVGSWDTPHRTLDARATSRLPGCAIGAPSGRHADAPKIHAIGCGRECAGPARRDAGGRPSLCARRRGTARGARVSRVFHRRFRLGGGGRRRARQGRHAAPKSVLPERRPSLLLVDAPAAGRPAPRVRRHAHRRSTPDRQRLLVGAGVRGVLVLLRPAFRQQSVGRGDRLHLCPSRDKPRRHRSNLVLLEPRHTVRGASQHEHRRHHGLGLPGHEGRRSSSSALLPAAAPDWVPARSVGGARAVPGARYRPASAVPVDRRFRWARACCSARCRSSC